LAGVNAILYSCLIIWQLFTFWATLYTVHRIVWVWSNEYTTVLIDGTDVVYNKFGESSTGPSDIDPSQDSRSGDYDCVSATTTGQWRRANCSNQHVAVCQSDYL